MGRTGVAWEPRRGRIGAFLAVVAIVVAVGSSILVPEGERRRFVGRFTHPRFGWTIEVPPGFDAFPIRVDSLVGETGVLVSNFEVAEPWSLAEFRTFPADGAALRIWSLEGVHVYPLAEDDSPLPLRLSDLDPARPYVGKAEPTPLFGGVTGAGHDYAAAAWFGPNASPEDREAIASAFASVSFRPTEPGTVIDDRQIVLGPAAAYPVGSVTRYERVDLFAREAFAEYRGPFRVFVVRGPNGAYAVSTDVLGNGARCDLRAEHDPVAFACPREGWRWDRFGRVVEAGSPWPDGTSDLLILPTPRSWDGNLLLDPFGNWTDAATEAW